MGCNLWAGDELRREKGMMSKDSQRRWKIRTHLFMEKKQTTILHVALIPPEVVINTSGQTATPRLGCRIDSRPIPYGLDDVRWPRRHYTIVHSGFQWFDNYARPFPSQNPPIDMRGWSNHTMTQRACVHPRARAHGVGNVRSHACATEY